MEGQTLTAYTGSWSGTEPIAYAYHWQRDGAGIPQASGATYILTAADVGHRIDVVVTASNSLGSSSATSAPSAVVVSAALEPPLSPPPLPPTAGGIAGFPFIGSVDTMKLSKDQAGGGFTSSDAQAVDLASTMAATHITVDTPLEYPSVALAWANRIHADGKHVWFRLASSNGGSLAHADAPRSAGYSAPYDGYPSFAPGYLTTLHDLMLANPGLIRPGDILDGDAEVENSSWWAHNYGCGVQQGCTPCPDIAHLTAASYPCSPVSEMNRFLQVMTIQENRDLESLGVTPCATPASTGCVLTQVHSTDPGTALHQLSNETVAAMGGLITIDAYPDQSTTDPATAASLWRQSLESWEQAWRSKGIEATILVGEWGYSNTLNVGDALQEEVIRAEVTSAFPAVPYLAGANYWVGPGSSSAGGYTNIFAATSGVWRLRPAAADVSAFYATMSAVR